MSRKPLIAVGIAALLLAAGGVAFAVMSSGDDGDWSTDQMFLTGMIPHHQGAIEMARVGEKRAQHPELIELSKNIVRSQTQEIQAIRSIHKRLFGETPGEPMNGVGWMSESMMGMDTDTDSLRNVQPFDREFIDQMISHHQGAIRMSQMVIEANGDPATRALAERIVAAQAREIQDMNRWRIEWYGSRSPSGGVPEGGGMPMEHGAMHHDGMMEGMGN